MERLIIENTGMRYIWYHAEKRSNYVSKYFSTNDEGEGVFFIDLTKNERHQLLGTCQFSLVGLKDPRSKIRRYMKEREERYLF